MKPVHARMSEILRESRLALCGEDNVEKFAGPMYGGVDCRECLKAKDPETWTDEELDAQQFEFKKWCAIRKVGKGRKYSPNDYHQVLDMLYVPEAHHDELCDVYWKYETKGGTDRYRSFWCATHGQWTSNYPIEVIYIYEKNIES